MNCALQRLLVAAFALQPGSNASTEFTVYSGRIGGLTAAKLLGASAEQLTFGVDGSKEVPPGPPTSDQTSTLRMSLLMFYIKVNLTNCWEAILGNMKQ